MKLLVFISLSMALNVFAASAVDILSLPAANRAGLLSLQKNPRLYKEAHQIAFSDQHGMSIRWKAVSALAEIRGADATEDLIKITQKNEWFMKNAGMLALNKVNPQVVQAIALKHLSDPALVVRSTAVDILKDKMDPEVRHRLWKELEADYNFVRGQSLWIRSKIVEALAMGPLESEKGRFAKALADSDVRMQRSAVRGLENLTGAGLVKDKMDRKKAVALWTQKLKSESPDSL